jgi:Tfp pilus assembly protein PilN
VKAVNLIPADQRRGGGGLGRSGGAVYALLGVLALVLVAAVVYVVSANAVTSKRDELHRLQGQTQAAQSQADALAPYRTFAALKQTRVQTIQSLASSRFDWERVMRKLALVIPSDVWLTSLVGTVAPGVQLQAGSGGEASGLRSAMPVPAVELTGCTTGQAEVSRFMSRLRVIDGVTRVSLASSEKGDTGGGTSGGSSSGSSGGGGGCENDSASHPQFDLVVFFGGTAK